MSPAQQFPASHAAWSVRRMAGVATSSVTTAPGQFTTESSPDAKHPGALDLVRLTPLMDREAGRTDIVIGLLDGPVAVNHPDLVTAHLRTVPGSVAACGQADSTACMHGTFVAGILCARRGSAAPAICPGCTLLVRPIFQEPTSTNGGMPSASAADLAVAIIETVNAGARVLNLSLALVQPASRGERALTDALDYAGKRGVITVVAAGNQSAVGSSAVTRHPWVIPVAACDLQGRPLNLSNLGGSIGRRGLSAPGDRITSLGPGGCPLVSAGTSVAAPFVTGAVALLWSEFPNAAAAEVRLAVSQAATPRLRAIVPPVLDAWSAYQYLVTTQGRK